MVRLLLSEYYELAKRNRAKYSEKKDDDKERRCKKLQLEEIALFLKQGSTQQATAKELGVSQQAISKRIGIIKKDFPELLLYAGTTLQPNLQKYNRYNQYYNEYVYENEYEYTISNGWVVSTKSGEALAEIAKANYDREDYWDNVTDPILKIQEDPSLLKILSVCPNYLSFPMLNDDTSYPEEDKKGWLYEDPQSAEKPRAEQHFDAANKDYRLSKFYKP